MFYLIPKKELLIPKINRLFKDITSLISPKFPDKSSKSLVLSIPKILKQAQKNPVRTKLTGFAKI